MKKVKTLSQLKKDLWVYFSKYIRLKGKGICFICGRRASGKGYHCSHFIPKSICGLVLYFSEKNNKGCCYNCNINLGGNLYEYGMKLGKKKVAELYKIKFETRGVVWDARDYEKKIVYYKRKLAKLEKAQ